VPASDGMAHAHAVGELWTAMGSSPEGLSQADADDRHVPDVGARSRPRAIVLLLELMESLFEPLQLLLIAVGVLSAVFGQLGDAIAIFVIIALVASVEAITEARAKSALRALRSLSAPTARVRRDATVRTIPADRVVLGDVLEIEAGDVIAADCRVVDAAGLAIDESTLTGEPTSSAKGPAAVPTDAPLAERSSMLYAGTAALAGSGVGLVVAAGAQSEMGRLGQLVAEAKEPATPLQRAMSELARAALALAIAASVLVPLIGVLRGRSVRQMLLDGLTLAFATIPEELPILVTVLVAVGGLRLAKRGVLLRTLRSAEAVGAITVLLTDKTGTLTENRLRLEHIDGESTLRVLDTAVAALGGASAQDPLDRALAAAPHGPLPPGPARRFPFDPQRKRESAVWSGPDSRFVAVKGAPEAVLAACEMTEAERERLLERVARLARDGLRVIAVAARHTDQPPRDAQDAERELSFVGLAAFADPLRPGVREAVGTLAGAGVRTIMVTGDHPLTAQAIAHQAGLHTEAPLLGGATLDQLNDQDLAKLLAGDAVIARATPADKLRLVRVLQQGGESVAVTGDGVNDAPALAGADVGIAMGARGTDLAREAADLILTDDAYPTIVSAVAGGRGLGAQLRRAVAFYLGAKIALVAVVAVPLALGLPAPFHPVHIVLLELFMDLGASVAFVSEPTPSDAMSRAPRNPAGRFLDTAELTAIAATALALTAAVLPAFLLVRSSAGTATATAAALTAWLIAHAAIAWTLRVSPRLPWARNAAFPAWALIAALTGLIFGLTPAAHLLGIEALRLGTFAITAATVILGGAVALLTRKTLSLPQRL